MSGKPVACVLVDALRHDYLEQGRTPFIAGLAAELGCARMRPILGYSDSIRATIFTGLYPDAHGYWMEYCFRPGGSGLAPLARLAPLDALPSDFLLRTTKFALSKTIVPILARRSGYEHLSLRHLPFRALATFDWTLRDEMVAGGLGVPTIFDRLTDAGFGWRYFDSVKLGRRGLARAIDSLPTNTRLAFVYLHHVDMASHVFGIESRLFGRALSQMDELVREVVDRLRRRLGDVDVVLFSDHGMSVVRRTVAFPELWRHPAFPERVCVALDATMVRFWYRDDDPVLRAEMRRMVSDGASGRFLGDDERRSLHLHFSHRLYGDEIYLLDEGTAIFPNFHSMLRPKAMHAYHPDGLEQHGLLIGGDGGDEAELVDLAPLLLGRLGMTAPAGDALARDAERTVHS